MIWFDCDYLIQACGDVEGVRKICAEHAALGYPCPSKNAIAVWKHRGRIPYDWMPVLVHHALTRGAGPDVFTQTDPREVYDERRFDPTRPRYAD